ncbi:hypothetical protein Clacol_006795 [Clathrus columnatus]|uniref:NADP-dependent oxidoreductase domain-containing protein n=1 Tax=Clathrus columnatus TaxID=1419009 RepID=A0AAV5AFX1_9AGAM|nr:hypothetical protein Clacol_006795 [Clathrus columnatus]
MATIALNNNNKIPWIGFGTGTALFKKDANEATTLAIKSGFIHLDGAQMYQNEDSLGKAISQFPRESLFVTTKLNTLKPGETVKESLLGSLERLGLDYVDLWLIHRPESFPGKLKDVWKGFEEVYQEGLTKNIGVSNFDVKHLKELIDGASVMPQINQVGPFNPASIRFHAGLYHQLKPLLEFQKQYGIRVESYGGLTPIRNATEEPLNGALRTISESLSKRYGAPVNDGQVLLKWLQAKDVIIITTSFKEFRLKEYLQAFNIPALTEEEIKAIDDVSAPTAGL